MVFSLGVAAAAPQRAAPTVTGFWEQIDADGRVGSWFYMYERDGMFEGKIIKMFLKPGEKANPICTKCPGDQKGLPTLGLTLIKGMQRKGRNYENGTVLDPRDGSVYNARMELSADGQKLQMRGYLGIEIFGQTQTWRRLPDTAAAELPPDVMQQIPVAAAPPPGTAANGKAAPPPAPPQQQAPRR